MPEFNKVMGIDQLADKLNEENGVNKQPTLYIGLGGFGCNVISKLKQSIVLGLEPEMVKGFGFLGLDTHPWESSSKLSQNEYMGMGIGVSPHDKAKGDSKNLDWFENIMHGFPCQNITAGANTMKPVGRLAFQISIGDLIKKLTDIDNQLRTFREHFRVGANAKVYIIGSMAGGTGSGCLLDAMAVIGTFFRRRAGAQFPFQAILAAPDVLEGTVARVGMPPLYANSYATLKEFQHLYGTLTPEIVNYNFAEFSSIPIPSDNLPDAIHLVTNRNEDGTRIAQSIGELEDIVMQYLLSEVFTPLSPDVPRFQDLENKLRGDPGQGGSPRDFSSFGVATVGINIELVGRYFLSKLIVSVLEKELAEPEGLATAALGWLQAHRLSESKANDLQELVKEKILNSLRVVVDAAAVVLQNFKYVELEKRAASYRDECRRSAEEQLRPMIEAEAKRISREMTGAIQDEFDQRLQKTSLGDALTFTQQLKDLVELHQDSLKAETTAAQKNVADNMEPELGVCIENIGKCIEGFFGRKDRVRAAVDEFQIRLDAALNTTVDLWVKQKAGLVYDAMLQTIGGILGTWNGRTQQLRAHRSYIEKIVYNDAGMKIDRTSSIDKREGTRFSIVNRAQCDGIFEEMIGCEQAAIISSIRTGWLQDVVLSSPGANSDVWWRTASRRAYDERINPILAKLTLNAMVSRFYQTDAKRKNLMGVLSTLSMPLFDLDATLREPSYLSYGIIALPESERSQFQDCVNLLSLDGTTWSHSETPHEVIIYQLRFGYTISSYKPLRRYQGHYDYLDQEYIKSFGTKLTRRPIHCWENADEWEDLIIKQESEEALLVFIKGRAFDRIFGAASASGVGNAVRTEFLYTDAGVYKMAADTPMSAPWILGTDRSGALTALEDHAAWRNVLRTRIKKKEEKADSKALQEGLTTYLAELHQQLGDASEAKNMMDVRLLRRAITALDKYLQQMTPGAL